MSNTEGMGKTVAANNNAHGQVTAFQEFPTTDMQSCAQMDLAGISARLIATLTGVSLKTATRWKRSNHFPVTAAALLELKLSADLEHHSKHWSGFRIAGELLWTPENQRRGPNDIRAIPYRVQQLWDDEREFARPRQFVLL